jgi:hypothetical protein
MSFHRFATYRRPPSVEAASSRFDPGDMKRQDAASTLPVPRDQWPTWAAWAEGLAQPQDAGIGDVVARLLGTTLSDTFKAMYRLATGTDCGCAARRTEWNAKYPLSEGRAPARPKP